MANRRTAVTTRSAAKLHAARVVSPSTRQNDVAEQAIGVFDSGIGGLTVLKALSGLLPREHLIYLGDTARYPYGSKSSDTVTTYAIEIADFLAERGIKLLVVACNTASAFAHAPASRGAHRACGSGRSKR